VAAFDSDFELELESEELELESEELDESDDFDSEEPSPLDPFEPPPFRLP
jgi:hypothetical protein